jgi:hypothetical protein
MPVLDAFQPNFVISRETKHLTDVSPHWNTQSQPLLPPSPGEWEAGWFHSQENHGFVGVVLPLLPVPTPHRRSNARFRHRGASRGVYPHKRTKQPWDLGRSTLPLDEAQRGAVNTQERS